MCLIIFNFKNLNLKKIEIAAFNNLTSVTFIIDYEFGRRHLWQHYHKIHCQYQDRSIKNCQFLFYFTITNLGLNHIFMCLYAYWQRNIANHLARISAVIVKPNKQKTQKTKLPVNHQMVQTKNNKLAFAKKEKQKTFTHLNTHS